MNTPDTNNPAVLPWLRVKLAEAEKALRCREEMASTWAGGTTESWRLVGCKLTKSERIKTAQSHERIAVKCRHEVDMLKAVIAQLTPDVR